ncbi:hypothetical protein N7493_000732 [Penicillium malachiteum]|uniref:AHC1-like C2H2 zinc-finger domain-containing protein n=1 Tax=Penicillium malachiteum TaxID=1324776 RepID=A0AAD6N1Q5_9EURO|nr:hypothetical protein N7493_000732 [Penicillium malachiteum]
MAEEVMLAPNCSAAAAAAAAVNMSLPLKRKRSGSPADAPVAQKLRTEVNVYVPSQPTSSPSCPPDSIESPAQSTMPTTPVRPPVPAAGPTVEVDRLRDTLTAQISLEVLLKHNELRLIDQEMAKCQVALEQLRRCAEIPYPGSNVAGISPDVSSGTGASVMVPGNGPSPMSPAPWGVTEGPYSRHYARWLLPDPDSMEESALAGKTRPQRGVNGSRLQSLPSGYPIVKEKAGPMLIRRKSDQLLVKLVCLDCKRDNFSSTQGFINHCRIAHNRNFASHEAAAVASGEPVELDSSGAVISTRSESTASVSTPGYVHPLIRAELPTSSAMNTPVRDSASPSKPSINSSPSAMSTPLGISGHRRRPESVKANPSFTASPATPHLSALMRERGLGLNLDKLVEEARTPVDLTGLSDGEMDFDGPTRSATKTPQEFAGQQGPRAARQPMRMPTAQGATDRTESRKVLQLPEEMTPTRSQSHHSISYLPHLSSLPDASQTCSPMNTPHDVLDHPAHLSPNTIESNQAPSLVSDDEDDYEAASDSDSPDSSEAGDDEEEFRHIEVQDDERSTAPSAPTESKPGPSLKTSMPQTTPPLPKSMKQGRPNHLPTMPSFNDRSRDEQPFNPMLDHLPPLSNPAKHGPVNFYRPSHPSEDPSKKNRENGRKSSP